MFCHEGQPLPKIRIWFRILLVCTLLWTPTPAMGNPSICHAAMKALDAPRGKMDWFKDFFRMTARKRPAALLAQMDRNVSSRYKGDNDSFEILRKELESLDQQLKSDRDIQTATIRGEEDIREWIQGMREVQKDVDAKEKSGWRYHLYRHPGNPAIRREAIKVASVLAAIPPVAVAAIQGGLVPDPATAANAVMNIVALSVLGYPVLALGYLGTRFWHRQRKNFEPHKTTDNERGLADTLNQMTTVNVNMTGRSRKNAERVDKNGKRIKPKRIPEIVMGEIHTWKPVPGEPNQEELESHFKYIIENREGVPTLHLYFLRKPEAQDEGAETLKFPTQPESNTESPDEAPGEYRKAG